MADMSDLLRGALTVPGKILGGIATTEAGKELFKNLAWNTGFALALAPKGEKLNSLASNTLGWWLTSGMGGVRMQFWQAAFGFSGLTAPVVRGVITGYRSALASRSMSGIPFSYNTAPMDQCFASLQYASQQMQEMSSGNKFRSAQDLSIGSEAQMYAARYMSK